jgi:DNA topoisomerase I
MDLIIVESPTKAKTISKFIKGDYEIVASYGHVRDLPKSKIGIDTEKDFEIQYVIPTKSRKNVNIIKKLAEKADHVILATDEDREGEAISYHLKHILELDEYKRIVFHEITQEAIENALQNPRQINMDLVDAQVGRRVLDRLVGYNLSPLLWKKVARGLSAGRVQSVCVRLIVEREREIEKFKPEEYWSITADFKEGFSADLSKIDNKIVPKLGLEGKQAQKIVKEVEDKEFKITEITEKQTTKSPLPPFTTSTLQQTAGKRLRLSSQQTMRFAQNLYERGLITYHRTDSLNLSNQSRVMAETYITSEFGKKYYSSNFYKNRSKGAQEAHEAIRPTDVNKSPKLDGKQKSLYELIVNRFLASQMVKAEFNNLSIHIQADKYSFKTNGQTLKFDGYLRAYPMKFTEMDLPKLNEAQILDLDKITSDQHFTKPPARYNEPNLIKALEEHGIGRPSTYAPTIFTIQKRNYVVKNKDRRFEPTEIGTIVNDLLVEHFSQIVNIEFTATMEEQLDLISEGKIGWKKVIKDFYMPFEENLKEKQETLVKKLEPIETDKNCPKCGSKLMIKFGRFGKFYACSGFPKCKHTESLEDNKLGLKCPKCKKGDIITRRSKRGRTFYGCSAYPDCDFAAWDKPIDQFCDKCNSIIVETAKGDTKCSNKDCGKD